MATFKCYEFTQHLIQTGNNQCKIEKYNIIADNIAVVKKGVRTVK